MQKKSGRQLRKAVQAVVMLMAISQSPITILSVAQAAEQTNTNIYQIKSGSLAQSLSEFASLAGVSISLPPSLVDGKKNAAIQGNYTVKQALDSLLKGTGLRAVQTTPGVYQLQKAAADTSQNTLETLPEVTARDSKRMDELPEVKVTSSGDNSRSVLPKTYAGGMVARGSSAGLLGNIDHQNLPYSAVSYTKTFIEDRQSRTITSILESDASFVGNNPASSPTNNEFFSIRGFNLDPETQVLFAGLIGMGSADRPRVEALERVEVFKGPNALLTGVAGAVGGAINLVPKMAEDAPLTRVTAQYQADGQFGGHVDLGRRFGADNQFGLRVNGLFRDGDTAVNRVTNEDQFISIAADYRGERVRLNVDVDRDHFRVDGLNGIIRVANTLTKLPDAPSGDTLYSQPWTFVETDRERNVIRGEWDFLDNWTLSGAFGTRSYTKDMVRTHDLRLIDSLGNYNNSTYDGTIFEEDRKSGRAAITGTVFTKSIKHQLSLAYDWTRSEFSFNGTTTALNMASNLYNPVYVPRPVFADVGRPFKTNDNEISSFAIADNISMFDDQLIVIAGVRQQEINTRSFDSSGNITQSYAEDALTPSLGIVVKPYEWMSIYGNYIEALESGGVAPITADNAGEIFSPLKAKQVEAGVKMDFGKFGSTLSFFDIERPSTFTDPVTNLFTQDGEQVHRGMELSVFGEPVDGFRLLGSMMLLDAEVTNSAGGQINGNRPVGVPTTRVSITGDFDIKQINGLSLYSAIIYNGSTYFNPANTLKVPSVTRFNVGANYRFIARDTPMIARLHLENAFGRDYWLMQPNAVNLGAPRTVFLSLSADF